MYIVDVLVGAASNGSLTSLQRIVGISWVFVASGYSVLARTQLAAAFQTYEPFVMSCTTAIGQLSQTPCDENTKVGKHQTVGLDNRSPCPNLYTS